MSSLWTPSGEHFPDRDESDGGQPPPAPPDASAAEDAPEALSAEAQAEVDAMREQLANSPAEVVVANHCYGLFELAAIYLSQTPPMLFQARLAIDGLGYPVRQRRAHVLRERCRSRRLNICQRQSIGLVARVPDVVPAWNADSGLGP
jgi:hypothetical protein